jgi:hypothetical protein
MHVWSVQREGLRRSLEIRAGFGNTISKYPKWQPDNPIGQSGLSNKKNCNTNSGSYNLLIKKLIKSINNIKINYSKPSEQKNTISRKGKKDSLRTPCCLRTDDMDETMRPIAVVGVLGEGLWVLESPETPPCDPNPLENLLGKNASPLGSSQPQIRMLLLPSTYMNDWALLKSIGYSWSYSAFRTAC